MPPEHFPMLGGGGRVPWSWGEQFCELYNSVHGGIYASVEELASRGGLGWGEIEHLVKKYRKKTGREWIFKGGPGAWQDSL